MSTDLSPSPSLPSPHWAENGHLMPELRRLRPEDRAPIADLLAKDGPFTPEEVSVALELVDDSLADPSGSYRVLVAELGGKVVGYICFGPTPMTDGTWDLYWVVTDPEVRGRGLGRALVRAMETELRALGARLVRVETSQLDGYGAAHAFYERMQYPVVAHFPDFYRPGDDLLVMMKRL